MTRFHRFVHVSDHPSERLKNQNCQGADPEIVSRHSGPPPSGGRPLEVRYPSWPWDTGVSALVISEMRHFDWKLRFPVGFQPSCSSAMNLATGNDSPGQCTRMSSSVPRGFTFCAETVVGFFCFASKPFLRLTPLLGLIPR